MSDANEKAGTEIENLSDAALDDAQGGVGLLLPAVQSVREGRRHEDAVLDFALTGDSDFSPKTRNLKK